MSSKGEEKLDGIAVDSAEKVAFENPALESSSDADAASSPPTRPKRKRKTAPKADLDNRNDAGEKVEQTSLIGDAVEEVPKKPRRRRAAKSATAVLEEQTAAALPADYISAAAEHAALENAAEPDEKLKGSDGEEKAEAPKKKRRSTKKSAEQDKIPEQASLDAEAEKPQEQAPKRKRTKKAAGAEKVEGAPAAAAPENAPVTSDEVSGNAEGANYLSVFDEDSISAALQAAAAEEDPRRTRSMKKDEKAIEDKPLTPPDSTGEFAVQIPLPEAEQPVELYTEAAVISEAADIMQENSAVEVEVQTSEILPPVSEPPVQSYGYSTSYKEPERGENAVQSSQELYATEEYSDDAAQNSENQPPEESFDKKRHEGFLSWLGNKIYRRLSFIGMRCIKAYRFFYRRFLILLAVFAMLSQYFKKKIIYSLRLFSVRNGLSFDFIIDILRTLRSGSRAAGKKGVWPLVKYWVVTLSTLAAQGFMKLVSSINYVAPFLALTVFIVVINSTLNMTFALKVDYNGEEIGYISDESVYEKAEKQMLGRIVFEDYIKPENSVPRFTITAVRADQLISEDELTDKLIQASGNELAEAAGLYIDDRFYGAVSERRALVRILDSVKDRFRSDDPDVEERIDFIKNVEVRNGLYPVSSVVDEEQMIAITNREEQGERIYITQLGDAPILIAQKNGIPYSQLKALNPDIESSLLVGQEILVSKSVPLLEVKVIRIVTTEEETNFKIEQIQDSTQYQGYVQITQRGKTGLSRVTREVTYVDGIETDSEIIDTVVISEPVNERVVVGGKMPLQQLPQQAHSTSSNFIWPVAGGYVSCGINGYWGHTGMDIAASTGTAVYASAAGTVTKAAYNYTGYGFHIIINHGGGVETLYGHNSQLHVKVGDWVEQGQLISSIGMTGRASGPHCHFEVRINGRYMDPARYIGSRNPYS